MIEKVFSLDGEEMEPGTEEGGETTEGEGGEETPSEEPVGLLPDEEEEDGEGKETE